MYTFHVKKNKGFTLIELLLYMSITAVMVVVISSVSISMLRTTNKTQMLQDVHYASSFSMAKITQVSSNAYSIVSPTVGAASSSVTFAMYDSAVNPTSISIEDGVLYLTEGTSQRILLHSDEVETSGVFTNITPAGGNDSIRITLDVTAKTESLLISFRADEQFETTLTLKHTP